MDEPTEIERLQVECEIANAKATMALTMLRGLVGHLAKAGHTDITIARLARLPFIEENELATPAQAFAALDLKTADPDDNPFDYTLQSNADAKRLRRQILQYIREENHRR